MKHLFALTCCAGLLAAGHSQAAGLEIKDDKAKVNYSIGYQVGGDFKRQGIEIKTDALLQGLRDALSGEQALMTAQEQQAILIELQRHVKEAQVKDKASGHKH
jgi:FKBP-type peptidyl-prolyl cis-trans isomerase